MKHFETYYEQKLSLTEFINILERQNRENSTSRLQQCKIED